MSCKYRLLMKQECVDLVLNNAMHIGYISRPTGVLHVASLRPFSRRRIMLIISYHPMMLLMLLLMKSK